MAEAGQRYWAFLSYSHADRHWASRLFGWLESFSVPARLVGRPTDAGPTPRRFRPIFRDRDELPASAALGDHLVAALRDSAYLIVICSPASARSRWVNEEIRQFKHMHGERRVLAFIVDGEPNASETSADSESECFPTALRHVVASDGSIGEARAEPAAADCRPEKDGPRRARLKLIAGMLQVDLDELIHREARQRYRELSVVAITAVILAAVMASLAVVSFVERRRADAERNRAVAERAQAEGLITFMIGDLRKQLEPLGRLEVLDSVGSQALGYYAAQRDLGEVDDKSLGRRSEVLHMLGEIRDRRGDLPDALKFFEEASRNTGELLAREPNDPDTIFNHAQSVFWVGYIAWQRGQTPLARQQFQQYQALADHLVATDPNKERAQGEVGYANSNLGTVLLEDGRVDEAISAFKKVLAVRTTLAAHAPADRDRQMDLGQSYAWLSDAEARRGDFDQALAVRGQEGALYTTLSARNPADSSLNVATAVNRTAIARVLAEKGELHEADAELQAATAQMNRTMVSSPDDLSYADKAQPMFVLLGEVLVREHRLASARIAGNRARLIAETLLGKDSTVSYWQGIYLGSARVLTFRIAAAESRGLNELKNALSPAISEATRLQSLLADRPSNLALAKSTAEAMLLAGDLKYFEGDALRARSEWQSAEGLLQRAAGRSLPSTSPAGIVSAELSHRLASGAPSAATGVRLGEAEASGRYLYAW